MLRIGAVVMNVRDLESTGAFWSDALGYRRQPHNQALLVARVGTGTRLHLDEDDRSHLDLWVDTKAEQMAEVERLVSLGATRVDSQYPDDADFIVLADPGGPSSASLTSASSRLGGSLSAA
jgi:catechol 2,3-dioxygenase-like lactoylglutathione lyase family enzyme